MEKTMTKKQFVDFCRDYLDYYEGGHDNWYEQLFESYTKEDPSKSSEDSFDPCPGDCISF